MRLERFLGCYTPISSASARPLPHSRAEFGMSGVTIEQLLDKTVLEGWQRQWCGKVCCGVVGEQNLYPQPTALNNWH